MALYSSTSRYGSPLLAATGHDGLHSVLLNEHIWSAAFLKKRRERATRWAKILAFGQILYEKLRIHYLLPVILLIAYSLAGGGIFYLIESSPETELLAQKSKFITAEKDGLRKDVEEIQMKVSALQETYANNTVALNRHLRGYRKFALNQLHKRVYWYALSAYYLTEQETHKQQALRPRNTEPLWRQAVYSTFGRIFALRNYTEQLALRCWEIGVENREKEWTSIQIHNAIERFDTLTGLNHVLTPVWTFWNAMLLAVTTYTTIGYGNITAKSRSGQLAVMLYAVVGIPLVLMILHKLGRLSLTVLAIIYQKICRLFNTLIGSTVLCQDTTPTEIPLPFAIGVAFGWMFLCAGIYLHFEEDWDYFKSFYFFFCSLTTIGYGDVTPTNSEDMFMIIILLLIGLSLVSMCINVIQLKLEKFFEEILLSVIEEYSSNPEARALRGDKIGFLDMWRVWKKRKARLREQAKASKIEAGERIAKVLPFARRRERQELIREIKQRLRQLDKSTQTERIVMYSIGCAPIFAPDRVPYLARDNERTKFAPLKHLMIPTRAAPEIVSPFIRSPESPSADTFDESPMNNPINFPPPIPSSSSYHIPLPHPPPPPISVLSPKSEWGSFPSLDQASNHSIPKVNRSVLPPDFNPARRWTFVETGKLGRGMPRGLINPMALRGAEPPTHRRESETARLLAEIDRNFVAARRELSTPSPYTTSAGAQPRCPLEPNVPPSPSPSELTPASESSSQRQRLSPTPPSSSPPALISPLDSPSTPPNYSILSPCSHSNLDSSLPPNSLFSHRDVPFFLPQDPYSHPDLHDSSPHLPHYSNPPPHLPFSFIDSSLYSLSPPSFPHLSFLPEYEYFLPYPSLSVDRYRIFSPTRPRSETTSVYDNLELPYGAYRSLLVPLASSEECSLSLFSSSLPLFSPLSSPSINHDFLYLSRAPLASPDPSTTVSSPSEGVIGHWVYHPPSLSHDGYLQGPVVTYRPTVLPRYPRRAPLARSESSTPSRLSSLSWGTASESLFNSTEESLDLPAFSDSGIAFQSFYSQLQQLQQEGTVLQQIQNPSERIQIHPVVLLQKQPEMQQVRLTEIKDRSFFESGERNSERGSLDIPFIDDSDVSRDL